MIFHTNTEKKIKGKKKKKNNDDIQHNFSPCLRKVLKINERLGAVHISSLNHLFRFAVTKVIKKAFVHERFTFSLFLYYLNIPFSGVLIIIYASFFFCFFFCWLYEHLMILSNIFGHL